MLKTTYYAAHAACAASHARNSSDELVRQIEFYFSDENLPGDEFLFVKQMKRNPLAPVAISTIGTFNKVKKLLRQHYSLSPSSSPWYELEISFALQKSEQLRLTPCGRKVARVRSMDLVSDADRRARTIKASRLPLDETLESVKTMFGRAGAISVVRKQQGEFIIEYADRASALEAVKLFDQSSDWRSGRRVKVMGKGKRARVK